uniref:Uncharacterized protein n=1 Tax=Kalanchoe fedtschenkoi TaxID=63787 RepID=A0A7N0TJ70_KALFE
MMCAVASSSSTVPLTSSLVLSSDVFPTHSAKRASLSWTCSFPQLQISTNLVANPFNPVPQKGTVVCAAWTRRSRGEAAKKPNKKSWK